MSNIVVKGIFAFVEKTKPVLVKVVPIEILRKMKQQVITHSVKDSEYDNRVPFNRDTAPDGINFIGNVCNESGLGQSCRLMLDALDASGVEHTIYNYTQMVSAAQGDNRVVDKITNTTPYNVNLIHVNPSDLILAKGVLDQEVWDGKYNIGFWLWEVELFPEEWMNSFRLVDEIWTPAEFVSDIMRKYTDKPVKTMVYPIYVEPREEYDRAYFNLPEDCFLYLTMYACNSATERKNPVDSILAYKQAFSPEDTGVGLVVKVNSPQRKDMELIKELCEGYPNIFIIEGTLSKPEVDSLIKASDVLLSMHRAEGFGLPLAEAMVLGTATIGTAWSANTEFMSSERACMVGYDLIELEEDYVVYKKGSVWANPHVEEAAEHMKKLYKDRAFYEAIVRNAKEYMAEHYSAEVAGQAVRDRIQEIYRL